MYCVCLCLGRAALRCWTKGANVSTNSHWSWCLFLCLVWLLLLQPDIEIDPTFIPFATPDPLVEFSEPLNFLSPPVISPVSARLLTPPLTVMPMGEAFWPNDLNSWSMVYIFFKKIPDHPLSMLCCYFSCSFLPLSFPQAIPSLQVLL